MFARPGSYDKPSLARAAGAKPQPSEVTVLEGDVLLLQAVVLYG